VDVNALVLFLDVVDAGSMTEAARRTGVPKSTISRKLRQLEEDLGVRLMQRTSRQLGLTDAGRRLEEHARHVAETIEAARRDVRATSDAPRGTLRVTTSVTLGERVLLPVLVAFADAHPRIRLELLLDPGRVDLVAKEIDVAIRVGDPDPRSPLIARRLVETALYPCASPAYLAERGAPASIDALREHDGIFYRPGRESPTFVLEDASGEVRRVTPRARVVANSHIVTREAALAGQGIACLPPPFCREPLADGRLVRVLEPIRTPMKWVYAAFPSRDLSGAARAFVDFVAERFEKTTMVLDDQ